MQEEGKGGPKKTVVAPATPVPTNNNNNASANTRSGVVSLKHIKSEQQPFKFVEPSEKSSSNETNTAEVSDEATSDAAEQASEASSKPSVRLRPNANFLSRYVGGCERMNSKVDTTPAPKEDIEITSKHIPHVLSVCHN
jgi:hypothetical protein